MKAEFAQALALAQGEFPAIKRDRNVTVTMKSGGKYNFSYAPLETILASVKPVLAKHGIALTQTILERTMVTVLSHGGESETLGPIPLNFREGMTIQEVGSMLTYAQRYSIKVALCLATEDDDDGNEAVPGNIYTVNPKGAAAMEAQAPSHRYAKAAEMLRSCGTLKALSETWEALTGEERRALAYVKDEMKTKITAADEAAAVEAGNAQAG